MLRANRILRVSFTSCLFVLLTVSFCPIQLVDASPRVIYVPDDYPTIKQALNASNSGDTIIVSEGTYAEGEIWITKPNLTLIANGTVVVDGQKEARWVLYMQGVDNVTIKGFTVRNSHPGYPYAGICLDHTQYCRIENNTVTDHADGIYLFFSNNNTVVNNNASFNDGYGIWLDDSDSNIITNNRVVNNSMNGIYLGGSCYNTLIGNIAMKNYWPGIGLADSDGNTLIQNIVTNNYGGIVLGSSGGSTLIGNNMTGNKYNLAVTGELWNEIDSSNFVDGKRVYYLKNQHDLTIDPSTFPDIGYLAVINSTGVTVRNITITNNWEGILFVYVTNSTIENVNVTRNNNGICLFSSHRNTLKGNMATANTMDGIDLSGSRYNNVTENTAICNDVGIWVGGDHNFIYKNVAMNGTSGIYVDSDNNIIKGNILANNLNTLFGGAIAVISSDNNSIYENTMVNNKWGVFVVGSEGSIIYHNNFIANVQDAISGHSTSIWDDGYPSGGNYWSDYNGSDFHRGAFQNITGSDGVGDTPYIIPDVLIEGGQDSYPLMKPYGGPRDVGIMASVSKKTIIAEGYYANATMNVTIINYGLQTETFTFTSQIYTTVQNQTVTLESRNSITFTFTFNTTDLPKGIYIMGAYITPVQDETYMVDNNYTQQIIITIPGDVDGDFEVDIYDVTAICICYDSKIGEPNYYPNYDVDGNGIIDIFDVTTACITYGQKYP